MHDLTFEIEVWNVEQDWDAPPFIDPMAVYCEAARRLEEAKKPHVVVDDYKFEPFLHPMLDQDV